MVQETKLMLLQHLYFPSLISKFKLHRGRLLYSARKRVVIHDRWTYSAFSLIWIWGKPSNKHTMSVYYKIKHYYLLQAISELKALDVNGLIFNCWFKDLAVCLLIQFDDDKSLGMLHRIFMKQNLRKDQMRKPKNTWYRIW